ncbi:hypothetical protein Tco_1479262 [Tanacetum coccineum]
MKYKVSQEHVCEEEVPLNNNLGKQSGDLVEMSSEAVEHAIDDHVSGEINGDKVNRFQTMLMDEAVTLDEHQH